jgi:O-antigen/teichoic acid export membrane protein
MLVAAPGVYGYNTIRYGLGYGSLLLAAQLLDVSDAGLFSVASMLSESVTLLATSVNMAFYPAVSSVADPGRFARRVTAVVMALCAGFGLLLVVVGRWLIPVVYGEAFAPAVPVFAALLPGAVLLGGEQVLGSLFVAAGRPIPAIIAVLTGAMLLPLFSLALADRGGLFGLAIASSLAHSITGALTMAMYWRYHRSFASSLRQPPPEDPRPGGGVAPIVQRR